MKILLVLKSPDAVYYALRDVPEEDREEVEGILNKFVDGDYLTVEVDTETATAKVVENE